MTDWRIDLSPLPLRRTDDQRNAGDVVIHRRPFTDQLMCAHHFVFLCAFLPIYFGAEHAKTIIDVLPQRLIDGLGVAGGIMPAIGFAVLLKIMMKNVYIPYFILGFVAAAWLKLPVLAIAAAALAMALIDLLRKSPEPTQPAAQKEEFEDGI